LCNNPAESDTAYRCFAALGALGTNALPQLMQAVQDTNHPYRGVAVRQVEEVLQKASSPSIQFPILLQCLRDRDSSLVALACQLLGRAGPNQSAVPFLQTNLLSPDPTVRVAASKALVAISSTGLTNASTNPFGHNDSGR
jgi:HEAT repeats